MSKFLPDPERKRLVIITGARQTGKTTLAKKHYKDLNYYNLDSPEIRHALKNISASSWGKTVKNSILDEAQKLPEIFDKVKYSYDQGDITFTVILGSSQILLLKKIRESLAGRVFIYELWPFMLSELKTDEEQAPPVTILEKLLTALNIKDTLQNEPEINLSSQNDKSMMAMEHILKWGGMPELLFLNDSEKQQWLKSYVYTYLERDLSDLARIDDLEPFFKFERLSALRSGNILVYSSLANDAGISVSSARRYLEYLRLSYQAILLHPYSKNITSSVIKAPKIFWIDTGIMRALTGIWGEADGSLFETFVVSELYKWIKTNQSDINMFYYRTRSGLEVDILLQTAKGLIGIEIKNREKVVLSDFTNLKKLASNIEPSEWLGGIVAYRGQKIFEVQNNLWAVPVHRLF